MNAIVLRPLPYDHPEQLFMMRETRASADFARTVVSSGDAMQWAERHDLFDSVAWIDYPGVIVAANGAEPETLAGLLAPASLFDVLRLRMTTGRGIVPDEDRPGQPLAVVISYAYWQRRFAGSASVLGHAVLVNTRPATIVGVLPAGFAFNGPVDIILPAQYGTAQAVSFGDHFLDVVSRLRPEVSRERAEADVSAMLRDRQGTPPHATGAALVPLKAELVGSTSTLAWLLLAGVGCVLAIACANIANLLLARATTRRREMAIRAALGAGRAQIVRQLLTESVLLAFAAGTVGVLLSLWGVDLLVAAIPAGTPRASEIRVDAAALAFATVLTLITGLVFGLAPALHASRIDVNDTLKLDGRGGASARPHTLGVFATAEIAMALALLVGAALLGDSFRRLTAVDPGFAFERVLTLNIAPPEHAYPGAAAQSALYDRLLERAGRIPGVVSAALVNVLPLTGNNSSGGLTIEGRPTPPPSERRNADLRSVTPDYFSTLGIRLVRGRPLQASDTASAPRVAVINQTMAAKYWPNEDPIGKRFRRGTLDPSAPWITIVGIVGDVRHRSLGTVPRQEMYFPFAQDPRRIMVITLRAAGDPRALTAPLRAAVHDVDPQLPTDVIQPMGDIVSASVQVARFSSALIGGFAGIALLLALIGIYSVMSFGVSQRRREIGVRMALGAGRSAVVTLVLRQALRVVAVGLTIGLAGAWALGRALRSMLFEVSATDLPTYAAVAAALALAAAGASLAPAYRATRIDPIIALRD